MVKAYLRYEPRLVFGVIVSVDSNISYDLSGKHVLAGALDSVAVWDIKKGICSTCLSPSAGSSHSLAVTSIASSPSSSSSSVASGHANGSIRLWDLSRGTYEATLNGHESAVTALHYNHLGSLLASGSKDCDIILWDVVAETGMFRLRGHRDQVTDLVFLDSAKKLVSCSKDKFVRVWDLEMQHCIQIVSGQHSEVWSLDVDPNERFLVTGSADLELRFYLIRNDVEDMENSSKWDVLKHYGEIKRQGKERIATVRFSKSGSLLACQEAGRTVEIYRVLDASSARSKAKRRVRRKKEKLLAKAVEEGNENGNLDSLQTVSGVVASEPDVLVSDVFKLLQVLRASKKICSIAFCPTVGTKGALGTLSMSLNNNMLETYSIEEGKIEKKHTVELLGHRSDIRSVTLSSDNTLLLSTSHNAVKVWNPSTGACIRTIESGYGLCCSFVPADRYALVGTKSGTLEIIDVGSGTRADVIEAHSAAIWSIVPIPDDNGSAGSGFVTGSADHDVKFWEYQLKRKPDTDSKQLTVKNVRTLNMNDDVLVVSISPERKYIAVALLDCTVQEEREKRLLEMFESDLETNENKYAPREELPEEGSVGVSGRKTQETITATDIIIDALDTAEDELKHYDQYSMDRQNGKSTQFQPNVMMRGLSPPDYVLQAISNVHTNDLEQRLLSLPYSDALKLTSYLKDWVQNPDKVALVCRITTVLLQTHYNQLITTPAARPILTVLKDILHARVKPAVPYSTDFEQPRWS